MRLGDLKKFCFSQFWSLLSLPGPANTDQGGFGMNFLISSRGLPLSTSRRCQKVHTKRQDDISQNLYLSFADEIEVQHEGVGQFRF